MRGRSSPAAPPSARRSRPTASAASAPRCATRASSPAARRSAGRGARTTCGPGAPPAARRHHRRRSRGAEIFPDRARGHGHRRPEPAPGCRHHLHRDRDRLRLPRRHPRRPVASGGRVRDDRPPGRCPPAHGGGAQGRPRHPEAAAGPRAPLRPWLPVRVRGLPSEAWRELLAEHGPVSARWAGGATRTTPPRRRAS
jgi:hypothetical protein